MISIELPWPPSVNNYYRRNSGRYFITAKGVQYRMDTSLICLDHRHAYDKDARLSVTIYAYPPDKRKRDLDNILKCLLDSLEKAQVFVDDSQIDEIIIRRVRPNDGKVIVNIKQC